VKRRAGPHSAAICELLLDRTGVHAGRQLRELHGVLSGTPSPTKANE
jgi:hypothetical protein